MFYGGSYRFYRLAGNTTLPTVLYAVGFACQVLGGVILLIGIRDDRRAAKRIPSRATWESVDVPAEVVKGRLAATGWRIAGVALIFVGAAVGLAANLLALSRT